MSHIFNFEHTDDEIDPLSLETMATHAEYLHNAVLLGISAAETYNWRLKLDDVVAPATASTQPLAEVALRQEAPRTIVSAATTQTDSQMSHVPHDSQSRPETALVDPESARLSFIDETRALVDACLAPTDAIHSIKNYLDTHPRFEPAGQPTDSGLAIGGTTVLDDKLQGLGYKQISQLGMYDEADHVAA